MDELRPEYPMVAGVKPKTLEEYENLRAFSPEIWRPWKYLEIPVGTVIQSNKWKGSRCLIVGATYPDLVHAGFRTFTVKGVFDDFQLLDGTPCGTRVD